MRKGVFLSLDGLDGTGKSTQLKLLQQWLQSQSVPVTVCTDPGGTELGAKLREILLNGRANAMNMRTEALLFMASRAELVETVIRPAMERGDVVVSDRYLLANVVYQGHAGGLDPADIWRLGEFSTGGLYPALVILLDLPVDVAKARRGRAADRLEQRGDDYFKRVRQGFLKEAAAKPQCHVVVSAEGETQEVHQRIIAAILTRYPHGLG
jgi:dTMP kinase